MHTNHHNTQKSQVKSNRLDSTRLDKTDKKTRSEKNRLRSPLRPTPLHLRQPPLPLPTFLHTPRHPLPRRRSNNHPPHKYKRTNPHLLPKRARIRRSDRLLLPLREGWEDSEGGAEGRQLEGGEGGGGVGEERGEVPVEDYGADGEGDGTAEDAGLAYGALGGGWGVLACVFT